MNREAFFKAIRANPFRGDLAQTQVDGITTILDSWDKYTTNADPRHIAYSLATTYHETARTMQPIEEIGHGRGRKYGIPTGPWKHVYDGRGFVQDTWLANYMFATKRLHQLQILPPNIDFAQNPDLMLKAEYAAPVMIFGMTEGWFTHHKLEDYFFDKHSDPVGARRIINGLDCARQIGGYYDAFEEAVTKV